MRKLIYLFMVGCLTISCKTDDVNDVRDPLPTIPVVRTVKIYQGDALSIYTIDYDQLRRVKKITRDSDVDIAMEFNYNPGNQVVSILVSGEGTEADGIGLYEYDYDDEGRLDHYSFEGVFIDEDIVYDEVLDQYNMTTPNLAFSFFENMDLDRSASLYFEYDLTEKGPMIHPNSSYHFISLLGPDPNLKYFTSRRPITTIGPASNPDLISFVNTFDDDDYVIESKDLPANLQIEYFYKLTY